MCDIDQTSPHTLVQKICVESAEAVQVLFVTDYASECDLNEIPIVLIHGYREKE